MYRQNITLPLLFLKPSTLTVNVPSAFVAFPWMEAIDFYQKRL